MSWVVGEDVDPDEVPNPDLSHVLDSDLGSAGDSPRDQILGSLGIEEADHGEVLDDALETPLTTTSVMSLTKTLAVILTATLATFLTTSWTTYSTRVSSTTLTSPWGTLSPLKMVEVEEI